VRDVVVVLILIWLFGGMLLMLFDIERVCEQAEHEALLDALWENDE